MSMSQVAQVSGWLQLMCMPLAVDPLWSACLPHAAEAHVTTSIHLQNHALEARATAVQQELSTALVCSVQEWAQCELATAAIRQLMLGVPFLTMATKKSPSMLTSFSKVWDNSQARSWSTDWTHKGVSKL
jgi:hypothetical protein